MSTAQQLGLIGNSIKVQSLPTASAETFGAGNRFYTLIGQQEGYITGHTYRTVVANDVYSWEDIAQAGPAGKDALVYNDTWGFMNVGLFNTTIDTFNRTPIVGEKVVIFSTLNQYTLATIESVSETIVGVRISGPIINTKGAKGETGADGKDYLVAYSTSTWPVDISQYSNFDIKLTDFNRTPIVNDKAVIIVITNSGTFYKSTKTNICYCTISEVGNSTAKATVNSYSTINGQKGEPGVTDYNQIENIPVINQDLSASGFTPVANTYYRHTGATTDTFTQGVIYLYDTAYHKLGESGGTTMHRYTMSDLYSGTVKQMKLLCKIVKESKGKIMLSFNYGNMPASCIYGDNNDINVFISGVGIDINKAYKTTIMLTINSSTGIISYGSVERFKYADNTRTVENFEGFIRCIYFNDTEIKL